MTSVRIDQNGLPKAPVYDLTAPRIHRGAVTAVDSGNPAEPAGIDTAGYEEYRFDLDIGGGRRTLASAGRHALAVPCGGQKPSLKATSFNGASFSLGATTPRPEPAPIRWREEPWT